MSITTPSPDSTTIEKVKSNLARMQLWNDYVYSKGNCLIGNCYLLMSSTDSSDPGLSIGIALMEGAFGVVGSFGAFGGFACCFMCAEVESWTTSTPSDLNSTFASMLLRFQHSSVAFDNCCAIYSSDPVSNWYKTFSYNGTTMVLGDLATITFPLENDPEFIDMAIAALKGLDIAVWKSVLNQQCWLTEYVGAGGASRIVKDKKGKYDCDGYAQDFIANNPAYYVTWAWHQKESMFGSDAWYFYEWNVGFGASKYKDNSIPDDACAYLFIDSTDNHIINPDGLVTRRTVFEQWGIRTTAQAI
jgi:hypothetical protein